MQKLHPPIPLRFVSWLMIVLWLATASPSPAWGRTFPAGSLIIPMDHTHQDHGLLQAYGLVTMLLRHQVPVHWVVAEGKRWMAIADCTAVSRVLYDDSGQPAQVAPLRTRYYQTGPFVIDAADAPRALEVIRSWNEPRRWSANPWAARSVFQVVTVHEATLPFDGPVARTLVHVPRPAILADSREADFARILFAAGIFQSNGAEFVAAPCQPGECGPGTSRPDFLPVAALMGDARPCFVNRGTWPGAHFADTTLFDAGLRPRYALVAAAGWTAEDRETITCEGGPCLDFSSSDETPRWVCFDPELSIHGHRIVNYLTAYSQAKGGLFFMGEAAFALENAVADPFAPVFDLSPIGHFVTEVPPVLPCPCQGAGTECVIGGCRDLQGGYIDCCLFAAANSRGAGILPGGGPGRLLNILNPGFLPFQLDGSFQPSTGPLGLFSPTTPDGSRVVMTPDFSITNGATPGVLATSRVLLLADFRPTVGTPVSSNPDTQVSRLFLNALFASEWAVDRGPVAIVVKPTRTCFGPYDVLSHPIDVTLQTGTLPRLEEAVVEVGIPAGITVQACTPPPETTGQVLRWRFPVGTEQDRIICVLSHPEPGEVELKLNLRYQEGAFEVQLRDTFRFEIAISPDTDGDGLLDCVDPRPTVPEPCGDADGDWRDDCSGEYVDHSDDNQGECCECGDYETRHDNDDWFVGGPCTTSVGRRARPRDGLFGLCLSLGVLLALRRRRRR